MDVEFSKKSSPARPMKTIDETDEAANDSVSNPG